MASKLRRRREVYRIVWGSELNARRWYDAFINRKMFRPNTCTMRLFAETQFIKMQYGCAVIVSLEKVVHGNALYDFRKPMARAIRLIQKEHNDVNPVSGPELTTSSMVYPISKVPTWVTGLKEKSSE